MAPNPAGDYSATLSVVDSSGVDHDRPRCAPITQIGDSAQYTVTAPAFTLPEEGTYQVLVAITDNSAATPITVTGASTATIADAALTAPAQTAIVANTGIALLRHHRRSPPSTTPTPTALPPTSRPRSTGVTAVRISTGTIVGPTGGPYSVEGGHTYAAFGTYTITTVVTDVGGSVVTLTNTATVTDLAAHRHLRELHGAGGPEHRHDRAGHGDRSRHAAPPLPTCSRRSSPGVTARQRRR